MTNIFVFLKMYENKSKGSHNNSRFMHDRRDWPTRSESRESVIKNAHEREIHSSVIISLTRLGSVSQWIQGELRMNGDGDGLGRELKGRLGIRKRRRQALGEGK